MTKRLLIELPESLYLRLKERCTHHGDVIYQIREAITFYLATTKDIHDKRIKEGKHNVANT
jgi:hypothetical protein